MATKQQILEIIWDALDKCKPVIARKVFDELATRGQLAIQPLSESDIEAICEAQEKSNPYKGL